MKVNACSFVARLVSVYACMMSTTIRFCTWNVQLGRRLERVLGVMARVPDFASVDVLALQEASVREDNHDAEAIANTLGSTFHYHQETYHYLRHQAQANALVWNTERVQLDTITSFALPKRHEVALSRNESAFLRAFPIQNRAALVSEGTIGSARLRICSAHLDVVGFAHKRAQFNAVIQELEARPPVDLTIVGGDFNTFRFGSRPDWKALKTRAAQAGLDSISDPIAWTAGVRSIRFRQKLDEIFAGSRRRMQTRVWTLDVKGSDHLPLFADITLEDV